MSDDNVIEIRPKKDPLEYELCELLDDSFGLKLKGHPFRFEALDENTIELAFSENEVQWVSRVALAEFFYIAAMMLDYEGVYMPKEDKQILVLEYGE